MPVMPLCQEDQELIAILCYIVKVRASLSWGRRSGLGRGLTGKLKPHLLEVL